MKKTPETGIIQLVVATGIASVACQLLIIREFLSGFEGNEFVIALIMFSWLVLGGTGTWAAHVAEQRFSPSGLSRLALLSMILAALAPLTLLAARTARDFAFVHGSAAGFYTTFAYIFCIVAPYCLLLGFLLPYSLFCARHLDPQFSGTRVYIADNIGDVCGGAVFSFILVFVATPLQSMLIVNSLLVASALFLLSGSELLRAKILIPAAVAFTVLIAAPGVEKISLHQHPGNLVHYEESRYGRIEIFEDHGQHTLFLDGRPVFSDRNVTMAEELGHYPLSQVKNVEEVLLISAEGGMIREIEKYSPERIDYVEIDPGVTRAVFEYKMLKKIPEINVIHADARLYLSRTANSYDAVIMNLPEPETFQINRFYTKEFFRLVRARLSGGGIFCFHSGAVGNYISEIQRKKISILYQTASEYFPEILMLPGRRLYFLCADRPLNPDIPALLSEKKISTSYVHGYYYGNITSERISDLKSALYNNTDPNTDFSPGMVAVMFSQWFAKFQTTPALFLGLLALGLLVYLIRTTGEEFVLLTTGAMTMGGELLVIFAFQIFFGYIYFQIGLIVTVFLAGLLPGALIGERLKNMGRRIFLLTDGVLVVSMGLFIAALYFAGSLMPESAFLLVGGIISVACGMQFPVALHLGGAGNPAAVRAFSADLIGAAAGTLVISVILMPYTGLFWSAAALIAMKTISLGFVSLRYE
ncbi:MAG: hypothetical protein K9J85_04205 [Desulfobacteraceae bacterium]|nr:hypothetical protein [Desulfobacteraceae bacterium]